jgi:hypothetical protein
VVVIRVLGKSFESACPVLEIPVEIAIGMPTPETTPRLADNLRLLAASQLQTLAARSVAWLVKAHCSTKR